MVWTQFQLWRAKINICWRQTIWRNQKTINHRCPCALVFRKLLLLLMLQRWLALLRRLRSYCLIWEKLMSTICGGLRNLLTSLHLILRGIRWFLNFSGLKTNLISWSSSTCSMKDKDLSMRSPLLRKDLTICISCQEDVKNFWRSLATSAKGDKCLYQRARLRLTKLRQQLKRKSFRSKSTNKKLWPSFDVTNDDDEMLKLEGAHLNCVASIWSSL